jgi:DNA-binding transcriptional regulator YhcF (GntR family)
VFDEVDPGCPTPLYEQIAARVRAAVARGTLAPGQAVPSVRHLAAALHVNPGTVVRAYKALESEGFVRIRQGTGTFIRQGPEEQGERGRGRAATELARELLAEAARLGVRGSDLRTALDRELGAGGEKRGPTSGTGFPPG